MYVSLSYKGYEDDCHAKGLEITSKSLLEFVTRFDGCDVQRGDALGMTLRINDRDANNGASPVDVLMSTSHKNSSNILEMRVAYNSFSGK